MAPNRAASDAIVGVGGFLGMNEHNVACADIQAAFVGEQGQTLIRKKRQRRPVSRDMVRYRKRVDGSRTYARNLLCRNESRIIFKRTVLAARPRRPERR